MTDYDKLQRKIIAACQQAEAVQGLILVGSRVRKDRPLDEHADLDYILFTPEPEAVKMMPGWIGSLATVWVPHFSYTGPGDPEWMVVYEGGFKVDFTFHKIEPDQTLEGLFETFPYQGVLFRGFEVLVDKTGSAGNITWSPKEDDKPAYPTETEFRMAVDKFLLEATRAIRFVARADMWRAKVACDTDLKHLLLGMIEWQAQSKHGLAHDTWYDGRYLSEWADPEVVAALPATFATYQKAALERALQSTLTLYDQLAAETAAQLGFQYPTRGQQAAINWLRTF